MLKNYIYKNVAVLFVTMDKCANIRTWKIIVGHA